MQQSTFVNTNSGALNTLPRKAMALLVAASIPTAALAGVTFQPHADGSYEYNANLFLISNDSQPQTDSDGIQRLDDRYWSYAGGINVTGNWGETNLDLRSDLRKYAYQHFTQLDHDDKTLAASLAWVATSKVSGTTSLNYTEHFTPFTELLPFGSSQSTSITAITFNEINREFNTAVDYQISSKWLTKANIGYSRATVPNRNPGAVDSSYDMNQQRTELGVNYGGTAKLRVGVNVSLVSASFSDNVTTPRSSVHNYQGLLDYSFSERTALNVTLGRSIYQQVGLDSSATTGSFSFSETLTPKTKYYLRFDRSYTSYPLRGQSQLSDSATFGATWQALRKLSLSANYGINRANFSGSTSGTSLFADAHDDKIYTTNVVINYDMQSWLSFSPYFTRLNRTSNVSQYTFDNHLYGITVSLRYQ